MIRYRRLVSKARGPRVCRIAPAPWPGTLLPGTLPPAKSASRDLVPAGLLLLRNTISIPQILSPISLNASTVTKIAIQLAIFMVAAVPGQVLGIARPDKIGHRRLQLAWLAMMAPCFAVIGVEPGMTTLVVPFSLAYRVSYLFTVFGPNMTTFVMPGELYPVSMRATGHGISAGAGKFGAFIGVFVFPLLNSSLGLRGTLLLTAGVSVLGFALTLVLPEQAGRSPEDTPARSARLPLRIPGRASAP
jgi:MFS transporter, PHS family, inorganic phosphate transporter